MSMLQVNFKPHHVYAASKLNPIMSMLQVNPRHVYAASKLNPIMSILQVNLTPSYLHCQ